ncbi:MAG: DNA replication and repair protein RecF [Treponema sp.]|nr:DNA replication and repair protein RecF [Treponema sp.]
MPFLSLSLNNFRNLKNDKIDLSLREIYFVGENGQGKSNILESLYYSAYGTSFRTHIDAQLIKLGTKNFSISSLYQQESGSVQKIDIFYENGIKRIEKNEKRIQDRKELINTIPCVLFCHDDMQFATGEPECRRFFLDQSLTMFDPMYIDDMRNYKKILKNRNQLLKDRSYEMLDIYDVQLAKNGLEIQKKRKNAVFQFNQIFGKLYEDISGISGVTIFYAPSWKELPDTIGTRFPSSEEIVALLAEHHDQDKIMETTLSGPHRDRIIFMYQGRQFIPVSSTGQQRLVALLLRVAQAVYYSRITGMKPVFLMDDVMLELDPDKRQKMTAMLPDYDQLFCTFLPGEPYERYKHSTTRIYHIKNGEWHD